MVKWRGRTGRQDLGAVASSATPRKSSSRPSVRLAGEAMLRRTMGQRAHEAYLRNWTPKVRRVLDRATLRHATFVGPRC